MEKLKNVTIIYHVVFLLVLGFFYCLSFFSILTFSGGKIVITNISLLVILSVILFCFLIVASLLKNSWLFFCLPVVLIAFPSPVNDLIPNVIITSPNDGLDVGFPVITHIDIFLICMVFKQLYLLKKRSLNFKFSPSILIFVFGFLIIFLFNLFKSYDIWDINLLIANSFQIRYTILILYFLAFSDYEKYQNEIIYGIIFSILFLFLESIVNTKLKGFDRLSSGSLAINTYANIICALLVFLMVLFRKKHLNAFLFLCSLFLCLMIIFLTGTRSALLPILLVPIFIFVIRSFKKPIKLAYILFITFFVGYQILNSDIIPKRYSITENLSKFSLKEGSNIINSIKIKVSEETNSLITRLQLFSTSLEMINEHPITGIGVGRWNKYKNEFGFKENILIDSHNEFLAYCSQFGIVFGLFLCFFIFIYPLILYKKLRDKNYYSKLNYLYLINFSMFFCAFTNAGSFKHQVFAIMIFSILVLYCNLYKIKNHEYSNNRY